MEWNGMEWNGIASSLPPLLILDISAWMLKKARKSIARKRWPGVRARDPRTGCHEPKQRQVALIVMIWRRVLPEEDRDSHTKRMGNACERNGRMVAPDPREGISVPDAHGTQTNQVCLYESDGGESYQRKAGTLTPNAWVHASVICGWKVRCHRLPRSGAEAEPASSCNAKGAERHQTRSI